MAAQIGVVKALLGEVTATATDGSVRTLQLGDMVYANELISTGPGGAVEIQFADGSLMDLGRSSQALLDNELFDPTAPVVADAGEDVVPDDVAAIQQALLEGQDPLEVGEATAAGAGVEGGENEGHEAVFVDYLNPEVTPEAGFDTTGPTNVFDLPEEDLIPADDEVTVSVSVSVQVEVGVDIDEEPNPDDPPFVPDDFPGPNGQSVVVSGNGAIVLEGTDDGDEDNSDEFRDVTFILSLDKLFDTDVTVTYQLQPVANGDGSSYPEDWQVAEGSLEPQQIVIPAGTTEIPVTVMIRQDHLDEGNGNFNIVLLSAETDGGTATINPDADTAFITIFDDDTTPEANPDTNFVDLSTTDDYIYDQEFASAAIEEPLPSASGNVLFNIDHGEFDPDPEVDGDEVAFQDQADTDEDGDNVVVIGVAAGDTGSVLDDNGTLGVQIQGDYGYLVLNPDGSYVYFADPELTSEITSGSPETDVFTYTITDTYNQPQTTTLTITLFGDSPVQILDLTPELEGGDVVVDEDDLVPEGSDQSQSTTIEGTFTIDAPDGVGLLSIGGNAIIVNGVFTAQSFATPIGNTLSITDYDSGTGVVTYTYTLLDDETHPDASGENSLFDNLTVELTDTDGDFTSDTLSINIVDDIPEAFADTNSVTEGDEATGNVLTDGTDDVFGADGADASGGVVGVAKGDTGTNLDDAGTLGGAGIAGDYGTLVLNADGSYTYSVDADSITGDEVEVFTYTIKDGDGDLTTATLTIDVADVTTTPTDTTETVYEAGLAGPPVGTDEASDSESVIAGSLDLQTGWDAVADSGTASFGDWVVYADGTFDYTLTTATTDVDAVPETDQFSYTAEDEFGNTVTNTVTITIVDDEPIAYDNTNSVTEGDEATGNVLTDGTDDVFGADGADASGGVVGVAKGDTGTNLDDAGTIGGAGIAGDYGTLVLNADGSYTYSVDADSITGDEVEVFTYTIKDGDGDLTTATLTIDVANVTLVADNQDVDVYEEALASGSNPTSTAEAVSGTLNVAGAVSYEITGASDLYGSITSFNPNTGEYTYTLNSAMDSGAVAGANEVDNVETYTYTATDANGNTVSGTITVDIIDDIPSVSVGDVDISGFSMQTSDADTVSGVGIATADIDFSTEFEAAVTPTYGADGAGSTVVDNYSLSVVPNDGATGLTSGGNAITLFSIAGIIYASTAANAGTVDGTNTVLTFEVDTDGVVTMTQYQPVDHLGVGNDDILTFPQDLVNLSADVTVTDGDDDEATTTVDTNLNFPITIVDDDPVFTMVNDGADLDEIVSLVTQNPTSDQTYTGNFFDWDYAADGSGDVTASNLPTGAVINEGSSTDTTLVLDFYEGDVLVATLTLNADGDDSLEVFRREPEVEFFEVASTAAEAGGPVGSVLVDLLDATDFNILVTATDGGAVEDVNASTQGWGVDNQNINVPETITFSFVDDGDNTTGFGVSDFIFQTTKWTGGFSGNIEITVTYIDADDNTQKTETIDYSSTSGVDIQISELTEWVSYEKGDSLLSVLIDHDEASGGFNVNGVKVGEESTTPPADLAYEGISIDVTDSDNDTESETLSLFIGGAEGDGLDVEAITGTSGDDILVGTSGDDIFIGGLGSDTMTGDTGADTFIINTEHLGVPGDVAADVITDFNEGEGDVLDLSDVLASGNTIEGVDNGGHLQVQVLDADDNLVQTIDLNTVNINIDATTTLNSLLSSGAIDDGV